LGNRINRLHFSEHNKIREHSLWTKYRVSGVVNIVTTVIKTDNAVYDYWFTHRLTQYFSLPELSTCIKLLC